LIGDWHLWGRIALTGVVIAIPSAVASGLAMDSLSERWVKVFAPVFLGSVVTIMVGMVGMIWTVRGVG